MFVLGGLDVGFDFDQLRVSCGEVDWDFRFGGADVAEDVEVVVLFVGDLRHLDASGEAVFRAAVLIGVDVFIRQEILPLAFLEMFFGVDKQHFRRFACTFSAQGCLLWMPICEACLTRRPKSRRPQLFSRAQTTLTSKIRSHLLVAIQRM